MADLVALHCSCLHAAVTEVNAAVDGATLDAQPTVVADQLVLTTRDLALPDAVVDLRAHLATLVPGVPRLVADHGAVPTGAVLDCGLFESGGKQPDVARWPGEEAWAEHPAGHHGHNHRRVVADHAFWLTADEPRPRDDFIA